MQFGGHEHRRVSCPLQFVQAAWTREATQALMQSQAGAAVLGCMRCFARNTIKQRAPVQGGREGERFHKHGVTSLGTQRHEPAAGAAVFLPPVPCFFGRPERCFL